MHPYIFTATIQFRIQDILGVQKNIGWLRCGGGGCTRVISGPRPSTNVHGDTMVYSSLRRRPRPQTLQKCTFWLIYDKRRYCFHCYTYTCIYSVMGYFCPEIVWKITKIALFRKFHSHFRAATRKLENNRMHPQSRLNVSTSVHLSVRPSVRPSKHWGFRGLDNFFKHTIIFELMTEWSPLFLVWVVEGTRW